MTLVFKALFLQVFVSIHVTGWLLAIVLRCGSFTLGVSDGGMYGIRSVFSSCDRDFTSRNSVGVAFELFTAVHSRVTRLFFDESVAWLKKNQ